MKWWCSERALPALFLEAYTFSLSCHALLYLIYHKEVFMLRKLYWYHAHIPSEAWRTTKKMLTENLKPSSGACETRTRERKITMQPKNHDGCQTWSTPEIQVRSICTVGVFIDQIPLNKPKCMAKITTVTTVLQSNCAVTPSEHIKRRPRSIYINECQTQACDRTMIRGCGEGILFILMLATKVNTPWQNFLTTKKICGASEDTGPSAEPQLFTVFHLPRGLEVNLKYSETSSEKIHRL